jgi:ribonuclease PH
MRRDGRSSTQLRPIRIVPDFTKFAAGSVLIETGETRVICTVSVDETIPAWKRNQAAAGGWLTAEYSMLPGATSVRSKRERTTIGGRTQEIQRLIGRSLRGVIDLKKCPDLTFIVDCDVIQADGGTRTAAITGSYVALKMAVDRLLRKGRLKVNPLTNAVAAVSVGIKDGEVLVDLDYDEDSTADLDMNVVMTQDLRILEIQGTAERAAFSKEQVVSIIEAASACLPRTFELQHIAADGQLVES